MAKLHFFSKYARFPAVRQASAFFRSLHRHASRAWHKICSQGTQIDCTSELMRHDMLGPFILLMR